jgi:hypothetical protein
MGELIAHTRYMAQLITDDTLMIKVPGAMFGLMTAWGYNATPQSPSRRGGCTKYLMSCDSGEPMSIWFDEPDEYANGFLERRHATGGDKALLARLIHHGLPPRFHVPCEVLMNAMSIPDMVYMFEMNSSLADLERAFRAPIVPHTTFFLDDVREQVILFCGVTRRAANCIARAIRRSRAAHGIQR